MHFFSTYETHPVIVILRDVLLYIYYIILYYTIFNYIILYYIALYYIILYYTILYYIILYTHMFAILYANGPMVTQLVRHGTSRFHSGAVTAIR